MPSGWPPSNKARWQDVYRPFGGAELRAFLLPQRMIITGNLIFALTVFLSVSPHALLLLLGVGLGTFAISCFRRAKKKKVEVSETAFRC